MKLRRSRRYVELGYVQLQKMSDVGLSDFMDNNPICCPKWEKSSVKAHPFATELEVKILKFPDKCEFYCEGLRFCLCGSRTAINIIGQFIFDNCAIQMASWHKF